MKDWNSEIDAFIRELEESADEITKSDQTEAESEEEYEVLDFDILVEEPTEHDFSPPRNFTEMPQVIQFGDDSLGDGRGWFQVSPEGDVYHMGVHLGNSPKVLRAFQRAYWAESCASPFSPRTPGRFMLVYDDEYTFELILPPKDAKSAEGEYRLCASASGLSKGGHVGMGGGLFGYAAGAEAGRGDFITEEEFFDRLQEWAQASEH